MTRNTVSVPPLEPRDPETPPGTARRLRPRAEAARSEGGMDPTVRADARIGDVPDVSSHVLMERDTPVNLYIAIAIGIGVLCVIVLLLWAFL